GVTRPTSNVASPDFNHTRQRGILLPGDGHLLLGRFKAGLIFRSASAVASGEGFSNSCLIVLNCYKRMSRTVRFRFKFKFLGKVGDICAQNNVMERRNNVAEG